MLKRKMKRFMDKNAGTIIGLSGIVGLFLLSGYENQMGDIQLGAVIPGMCLLATAAILSLKYKFEEE